MNVIDTPLEGLKVIELKQFDDNRGFFMERFNVDVFNSLGLNSKISQVNHSFSRQNVVRGLHFQQNPWQGKIVGCITGAILDVAVDIRKDSETFGQYFSVLLDSPAKVLYIPGGFAHGFSALSDANVMYFTDELYSKNNEYSIRYDSCNIDWKIKDPIVSDKDLLAQTFEEYAKSI